MAHIPGVVELRNNANNTQESLGTKKGINQTQESLGAVSWYGHQQRKLTNDIVKMILRT